MVVPQRVSQEEVCIDVGADPGTAMQLVEKMQTTNVQLDQAASSPSMPPEVKDTPPAAGGPQGGGPAKPEDDNKPKKEKIKKEKPLASWHLHC